MSFKICSYQNVITMFKIQKFGRKPSRIGRNVFWLPSLTVCINSSSSTNVSSSTNLKVYSRTFIVIEYYKDLLNIIIPYLRLEKNSLKTHYEFCLHIKFKVQLFMKCCREKLGTFIFKFSDSVCRPTPILMYNYPALYFLGKCWVLLTCWYYI